MFKLELAVFLSIHKYINFYILFKPELVNPLTELDKEKSGR